MVFFLKSRNDGLLIHFIGTKEIDDYAKDGGPEAVWLYVVFTMILRALNWQETSTTLRSELV